MHTSPFETKSVPKAYFSLALPVVFGMIVTIFYNITDTYFIAKTGNTFLVAGISLCAPVFTLLMAFGNIFGQGGSSMVSRLLGENRTENIRRVSAFCFYIAIITGALFGGLMLAFRGTCLRILGADTDTAPFASAYFTCMAAGAPLVVLTFIHTNLLQAEGMSKQSMIGNIGGSLVNIVLDPVFIFGLKLGAAGAAIATLLGYVFTNLYCLIVVLKKSQVLSVSVKLIAIPGRDVRQIFTIGIAAALSNIMSSFCMVLTNQSLLPFGSDKIAAMGIVQKVSMVVMLVITGFSFGGAPLIGFYYGRKDTQMLHRLLRFVGRFLGILSAVLSAMVALAAPLAVQAFLTGELADTAAVMLRLQVAGMIFMAAVLLCQILFQATGKPASALVLALSRQGVVFAAVLAVGTRLFGYSGIISAQPAADFFSALLALCLAYITFRRDPVFTGRK